MRGPLLRILSQRVPIMFVLPIVLVSIYFIYSEHGGELPQWQNQVAAGKQVTSAQPAQKHTVEPLGDVRCKAFPDPGNLLITIKTGATEAYEKLLPQILTSLGCSKQFEIFSDLEETIGSYKLHDSLKNFDPEMKRTHPDFEIYRLLQEYQATGQDLAELAKKHKDVWTLDKYKFMHMVQDTWDMHPNLDWYMFIESDTYVFWTNLNIWLQRLDASEMLYLGSEANAVGQQFAHGGSGFVLSGKLLKKFAGDDKEMASRNDKILETSCCGDMTLARGIQKYVGVQVQNNWPWINGENPWTIPFNPDRWCLPIITFHHVSPRQRAAIYRFEQQRENPNVKAIPTTSWAQIVNSFIGTGLIRGNIRTYVSLGKSNRTETRLG